MNIADHRLKVNENGINRRKIAQFELCVNWLKITKMFEKYEKLLKLS